MPTEASELKDQWAPYKHCDLFTFTDASKANGPDTSKATFDVSWKESGSADQVDYQLLYDMIQQMQEENEEANAASSGGLAAGAVFLMAVAAIHYLRSCI